MSAEPIECPKCGKKSLYVEHPDEYEVWLKCHECDYFRGMSKDDWHKLENSPNLEKKLQKHYSTETGNENKAGVPGKIICKGCKKSFDQKDMGPFGQFCKKCWYKFLILILVLMVIGSYMVWMMLF